MNGITDPSKIVLRCLDVLQEQQHKAYELLSREIEPRTKFCFPKTLNIQEQNKPSLDFLLLHIIVPQPFVSISQLTYKSVDQRCEVKLNGSILQYTLPYNEAKEIEIAEKITIYTKKHNTVDLLLIEKPFREMYGEESTENECTLTSTINLSNNIINLNKNYVPNTYKWAKEYILQVLKKCTSETEGQIIYDDFILQSCELITKFNEKCKLLEGNTFEIDENKLNRFKLFIYFAKVKLQQIQSSIMDFLMSQCNLGNSPKGNLALLYQPIEE